MISSTIKRLNDRRNSAEEVGEDAGFTLIELMVVLLILAILLAIAIPTFLGVTKSANDRAAQSNLNTALVNAKSIFQNNSQSYALGATGTASVTTNAASLQSSLSAAEPNLSFATGTVTSGGTGNPQVGVTVAPDGNGVILVEQAKGTANCWYIIDNAVAETATAGGPYANFTGSGTTGSAAALAAGTWYGKVPGPNTSCSTTPPAPMTVQASGFGS
jgi:type IV pilus assembly protein PilA